MRISHGKLIRAAVIVSLALSTYSLPAHADASSTNYAVAEDRFTGGGGAASSANYQLAETSFDQFGGSGLSSANYGVDTKIGIVGGLGVAVINSISPSAFAWHYSDENASYTVTAISEDDDTLQYAAKQGTTTKVSAQSSNVLSWSLTNSDIGRHTMTLEAIDPDGTAIQTQDAYVVRRPVK